jgi:hypothetical protein
VKIFCPNRLSLYDQPNVPPVGVRCTGQKIKIRKQLAVKRSERRALMSQVNPDEKRVAALTGEIFDLRNLLDDKAKESFGDTTPLRDKGSRGRFCDCGRGPRY